MEKQIVKQPRRIRKGKTEKDRKANAQGRNAANKFKRGQWSKGEEKNFPMETVNGKGNSSKAHKGIHGSKVKHGVKNHG